MRARNQAADSSVAASLPGAAEIGPEVSRLPAPLVNVGCTPDLAHGLIAQEFGHDVNPLPGSGR